MDEAKKDDLKEKVTKSESSSNDNWHEPHIGQLTADHSLSSSPNLPPHLGRDSYKHGQYSSRGSKRAVVFLLIISLAAGFLGGWFGESRHTSDNTSIDSPITDKQVVLSSQGQVISKIASVVGQSVVSVTATQGSTTVTPEQTLLGLGGGNSSSDAGTGIIISSNGLIITNRHVVPVGTTSVSVTLADGTQYNNVQVVGRTSANDSLDIAFLQIPNLGSKKLIPATIGDSSQMLVGDPVVAIGNALGQFQNTVTSGIISGYGRSVQASNSTGSSSESLDDLFQTDAAINEGNSGGPLVNLSGQVIGINTAIASNSQNIGFAIPINDVTGLIKGVEQTGKLEQPYLGIVYIPITADVAQQYNLNVDNGAYIPSSAVLGEPSILSGGPAAAAGLREGDIITKVNSKAINETTSLTSILDQLSVGQKVSLTVVRNSKTITISATLGTAPTS